MAFRHLFICFGLAMVCPAFAQTNGEALTYPGGPHYAALKFNQSAAWYSYLMLDVHQKYAIRKEELSKAAGSKDGMLRYLDNVRERLNEIVGELPERQALNARVVGKVNGNGFSVEKIVFESVPGRYVTAHLYLPENTVHPVPACIEMCGHGLNGKGNGSITAVRMALNGIAVMVVDPIAQGERLQLINDEGQTLIRGVTTEHTLLNPAFNLLGSSLAVQEFWDNSRAMDYLQSREEIDKDKIGAYGFSGGGTQAAYLMALDARVKVGCVGLFFSSRERTLELQGASDGCQQIPYEGQKRLEIADLVMLMAPKPVIVLDGKYDFVDHWGALNGFDEMQKCYAALGCPENVAQYYAEDGHALPLDVQVKLTEWFKKGLFEETTPDLFAEASVPVPDWKKEEMQCTVSGQVNLAYKDALSIMDEVSAKMRELSPERESFCQQDESVISRKMLDLLGLEDFQEEIEIVPTGRSSLRDFEEYRYQLNCKGQMPVACVIWVPLTVTENSLVEIHLHERGKAWFLDDLSKRDAVSNGNILVAADFRGVGELEDLYLYNYTKYWNKEYRAAAVGMHLGRPLMGQRVADLHTLLNFCQLHEKLQGHAITIVADGLYGPVVMHSAYLDQRIRSARLSNCVKTWESYLTNPMQRDMYSNVLYGALKYYDLQDLIRLCNGRVKVED